MLSNSKKKSQSSCLNSYHSLRWNTSGPRWSSYYPHLQLMRLVCYFPIITWFCLNHVYVPVVREALSSHIISLINTKTEHSDGLLELLLRLIQDGMWTHPVRISAAYLLTSAERFSCELASDHLMLSATSVLLMRPQAAKFRSTVAKALRRNYDKDKYLGTGGVTFPDGLVDLFLFTMFGRHATKSEVEKWIRMDSLVQKQVEQGGRVWTRDSTTGSTYYTARSNCWTIGSMFTLMWCQQIVSPSIILFSCSQASIAGIRSGWTCMTSWAQKRFLQLTHLDSNLHPLTRQATGPWQYSTFMLHWLQSSSLQQG